MIVHGIEVGLDVQLFLIGFLLPFVPLLLISYALWDRQPEMRLWWRRVVAWRAWRQVTKRQSKLHAETEPF